MLPLVRELGVSRKLLHDWRRAWGLHGPRGIESQARSQTRPAQVTPVGRTGVKKQQRQIGQGTSRASAAVLAASMKRPYSSRATIRALFKITESGVARHLARSDQPSASRATATGITASPVSPARSLTGSVAKPASGQVSRRTSAPYWSGKPSQPLSSPSAPKPSCRENRSSHARREKEFSRPPRFCNSSFLNCHSRAAWRSQAMNGPVHRLGCSRSESPRTTRSTATLLVARPRLKSGPGA
jgi:transposase-like protein